MNLFVGDYLHIELISKALHTGWSRGRLPPDSGKVQRRPLNPWRLLVGWMGEYQWDEVQRQVSQTLTQSENPQNETNNLCLPRDRDQDGYSGGNCAQEYTGGWWYNLCHRAHPTGLSSDTKKNGNKYVTYKHGGERGTSYDGWSRAEFLLVPN